MADIILENICKNPHVEMPEYYKNLDIKTFGIDWTLHDYQQKALKNALNALYLYFNKKEDLINYYKTSGIAQYDKELSVHKDNSNFDLLSEHFDVEDDKIDFSNFSNRASFWMATGSGKTLVLVKLIEQLYQLASNDLIPKNDILLLAPKPKILKQIKQHVEIFNKNGNLRIELKDLREWERIKQGQLDLYDTNTITVFYSLSHHLTLDNKELELDYKTFLNNGKWYVLLDEAHKGDSEDSKRQQYYTLLSQNGFLFNFSATFTDTIDIVTTVYNFNLKKFIEAGYGKHLRISGEEFKDFNKKKDSDFTDIEKYKIVLKSLVLFTAIKKEAKLIRDIDKSLYHNPLLITIANEVNTPKADLKLFFHQLGLIASDEYDLKPARDSIIQDLNSNRDFQFKSASIPSRFINLIGDITKQDILKYVFHATSPGIIEYTRISNNSREIAFRIKTAEAGKHFCLLVASDATNWSYNVLTDYEFSNTPLKKSFFKDISKNNSEINILLGSRIFTEGWDSNRPNIINLINMGVDDKAQKLVLQATGRGVRIQPISGVRKRLNHFSTTEKDKLQIVLPIEKEIEIVNNQNHLALESLHIFATNKEVIKKIIEGLNRNSPSKDWSNLTSIKKNEEITENLLIASYEDVIEEIPAYTMSTNEYQALINFVGKVSSCNDKILIMQCPDNAISTIVETIKEIRTEGRIILDGDEKHSTPMDNLLILNNHFHQKPKRFKSFKKVSNEIVHFEHIQVANLNNGEIKLLEERIADALTSRYNTSEELIQLLRANEIDPNQFQIEFEKLNKRDSFAIGDLSIEINKKFLKEHYYRPILIADVGFEQFIKHVISEPSEREFLSELVEQKSTLDKYDWWYFSKLDETLDKVNIPYYDTKEQKYREFFPDFIFWLKKDGKYYIKFIDPKGNVIGIRNAKDKAKGYENYFKDTFLKYDDIEVNVDLFFYNHSAGFEELSEYYTKDFTRIFNE
jgi:superfamily II DNA or RNA helicase